MNKDLFSSHSGIYAAFRPTYPESLYQFIFHHLKQKDVAWDCGTGNGQVATRLAEDFKTVYATDLSENQIKEAVQRPNIVYSTTPAEETSFASHIFDLITVGQALHWFNADLFYQEARRVLKPGGTLAIWGYGNIMINHQLDPIVSNFYHNIVGRYWDSARRHVETEYAHIPFPFNQIAAPKFYIEQRWTLQHLSGYLESWSSTQKYIKQEQRNPIPDVVKELENAWGPEKEVAINFPIFLKLAVVE